LSVHRFLLTGRNALVQLGAQNMAPALTQRGRTGSAVRQNPPLFHLAGPRPWPRTPQPADNPLICGPPFRTTALFICGARHGPSTPPARGDSPRRSTALCAADLPARAVDPRGPPDHAGHRRRNSRERVARFSEYPGSTPRSRAGGSSRAGGAAGFTSLEELDGARGGGHTTMRLRPG